MKIKQVFGVFGLILILIFSCSAAAAAGDGALDLSFNPGLGVSKIPIIRGQADWTTGGYANGNSLIWGYFTSITDGSGKHTVNSIAKLTNFNGTVDTNFNIPVNGEVRGAYLADPTNFHCDIIIWGSFSLTASAKTYYNLARLYWNGAAYVVDATFPQIFNPVVSGAGVQVSAVNAVAVMGTYLSGYVMVGGYNMQVQGDTSHAYHLIRLNPNFSYDNTYGPTNAYTQAKSLPGGYVTAIGVQSTNQPRIVGTLPVGDGSGHWNGTFHWFEAFSDTVTFKKSLGDQPTNGTNYGPIDGPIFSFAQPLGSTGPWIITGVFHSVFNNNNLSHIAQLNSNLTGLDTTNTFNDTIATLGGADRGVQHILIQGNGQPVLAGSFTIFNGTPCGHIVRLNYSPTAGYGTVDTSFVSTGSPTAGADDRIFGLFGFQTSSAQSYMQILGAFQKYNGTARGGIATLNPADGSLYTGSYPSPFAANSNTPGTVYAIDTTWVNNGQYGQNDIVIGGDFTGVNGKYHQNLAFLNLDGSLDDTNYPVTAVDGQVNAIRGLDGGQILIGGHFGQIQGYGCTSLARLNSGGGFDTSFRPIVVKGNGLLPGVRMTDMEDNGNVDIGGNFAAIADSSHTLQPRNAFALLNADGSLDPSFNAQFNIPNGSKIKVNAGGNMGSGYGMVGYVLYNNTSDYGFGCVMDQSGTQQTYMLFNGEALCGSGHGGKSGGILVAGNFTQVVYPVSAERGHIAALTSNFTLDNSSFTGAGTNGPIYALYSEGDNDQGKPLIGGAFSTYKGVGRSNVARLNLDGSLDTSFNPGIGANGPVYAIRWDNNKAVIGGAFNSYASVSRPGIAQVFASFGANLAPNFLLLLGN